MQLKMIFEVYLLLKKGYPLHNSNVLGIYAFPKMNCENVLLFEHRKIIAPSCQEDLKIHDCCYVIVSRACHCITFKELKYSNMMQFFFHDSAFGPQSRLDKKYNNYSHKMEWFWFCIPLEKSLRFIFVAIFGLKELCTKYEL